MPTIKSAENSPFTLNYPSAYMEGMRPIMPPWSVLYGSGVVYRSALPFASGYQPWYCRMNQDNAPPKHIIPPREDQSWEIKLPFQPIKNKIIYNQYQTWQFS